MNDKKLIELVRKSPVLYDLTDPNYMDTEFKNNIWSEIGQEMKAPGPLCKARWSNIRDNFRKSLRKSKIVNNQQGKTIKRYKYSQQLNFLTTFFEKKEVIPNTDNEVTNQYLRGDDEVSVPVCPKNEEHIQDHTPEINNPAATTTATELETCTSSNSQQTDSFEWPVLRKRTKHSVPATSTPKSVAATVMEYLIKKNESMRSCPAPPQHPVDAFLSGIAPVLKKLPPRYWHYAKADIFTIVQKYEYKVLTDQKQLVDTSLVAMSPTPSLSDSPTPAYHRESISTCSTPSFSEQPSPTDPLQN